MTPEVVPEAEWARIDTALEDVRETVRRDGTSEHAVTLFREAVWTHYAAAGRSMAWRETRDPYRILVSEVMLQQTRVERVRDKYEEFLATFPDVESLAEASLEDVLRVWKGLGYNRRGLNLHRAARIVMDELGGKFPKSADGLLGLPGVGPATAAGVAAFAFDEPAVYLETNVRTVMLFCFFPERHDVKDSEVREVVELTLDREDPRSWYYALLDLGVALKRAHPNPSRGSAHHTRQAPFEGSDRQVRGRVLEVLLDAGSASGERIVERLGVEAERGRRLLAAMAAEGFLVEEAGSFRIG